MRLGIGLGVDTSNTTDVMGGQLKRMHGAFAIETEITVAFSGQLKKMTGAFTLGDENHVALSANLKKMTGAFALAHVDHVALSANLKKTTGAFALADVAPTISSVVVAISGYSVGDIDGLYAATITGTGFSTASAVTFGGTSATITGQTSTTITCTVPAHTSGPVSVAVTNPVGTATASNAFEYYSPAQESCTSWERPDYSGNLPWSGTASAGGSGTESLSNTPDVKPSTGTTVNGYTPAKFAASASNDVQSASNLSSLVTAGAGTIAMLVKIVSAAAPGANAFADPAMVNCGVAGNLALSCSTSGWGAALYDGAQKFTGKAACATGVYALVVLRWDSTNVKLRVNRTNATNGGAGAITSMGTNKLLIGKQAGVSFANCELLETITLSSAISDATSDKIDAYLASRYQQAI